jgi:hypothetical protein
VLFGSDDLYVIASRRLCAEKNAYDPIAFEVDARKCRRIVCSGVMPVPQTVPLGLRANDDLQRLSYGAPLSSEHGLERNLMSDMRCGVRGRDSNTKDDSDGKKHFGPKRMSMMVKRDK